MKRKIPVTSMEHGYDFITLYFSEAPEMVKARKWFWCELKRMRFEHLDLQNEKLTHKEGDPDHFHTDGYPTKLWGKAFHHFHIVFPRKPTKEDFDFIKRVCKSPRVCIHIGSDIEIREVKKDGDAGTDL